MVVPVEIIWEALWRGYAPLAVESTKSGIATAALLHEVLQHPQVKGRDPVTQRLALLFIMRTLPVLFASEAGARRLRAGFMDDTQSTFLVRRLTAAEAEERKERQPPIPADFKTALKQELRDEILGRKSAHQLVDISREMQVRKPAKRNATVGDLRPSKRQKRAPGQALAPSSASATAAAAVASAPGAGEKESSLSEQESSASPLARDSATAVVTPSAIATAEAPTTGQGGSDVNGSGVGTRLPLLARGSSTLLLRSATAGESEVRRLAANRSASMLVQPVAGAVPAGSAREVQLLRATVNIMQQAIQNLTARVTQLEAKERKRAALEREKEGEEEEEEEELALTPPVRSQPQPRASQAPQRRPQRQRRATSATAPPLARPMLVADGE